LSGVQVERCDVVRLLPTPQQEELLRYAGDQCARLINMENYCRRRLFFANRGIDAGVKIARQLAKTIPEYLEVKEILGSMNFDETLRKVSEAWKSFAAQLKERKEGKLPPWMNPRPPGYRKRNGEHLPIIIVRADNYRVDVERKVIHLGYWNISVQFAGKLRWLTKPGAKRGRERWHGAALQGKALKSDYYFEKRIAGIDRALSRLEEADRSVLWEERMRLYEKRRRRRDQAHANAVAHLAREALKRNTGIVFIGYPWHISREKPGKGNTNMWCQRRLMLRLATTLENAGIPVFAISEDSTSKMCAYHGCDVLRKPRGLVTCPHGHTMLSDVNGALNIMLRGLKALGIEAEPPTKIRVLSLLATPSRVKPIKP
jgi:putative transposase